MTSKEDFFFYRVARMFELDMDVALESWMSTGYRTTLRCTCTGVSVSRR